MKSFKQFVKESEVPVNSMGSGSIATFDPLLVKKIIRRKTPNVATQLSS